MLEGNGALDGGLDGGLEEEDEEDEDEEEEDDDEEVPGEVQEIAKPQEVQEEEVEAVAVEQEGGEVDGQEEGQEAVAHEVVDEVVQEVVQEVVDEDQQKPLVALGGDEKVMHGLDVVLEGAMEIVNEVFAAPGPLFTEGSHKSGGEPLVGGQHSELVAAKQEVVAVEAEIKDAVVVPAMIPQVVQPSLIANRQDIVEPEQQQQQHQQQQQQQPVVGRKRGYSSDWKDNGVLDIAPSSKNPRELQRMLYPL